jgi:Uma2 family endonuclease
LAGSPEEDGPLPPADHRVMSVREMQYEVLEPVPIPAAKPAIELIDGRLVQKMSPKRRHQELEFRWTLALRQWGGDRGGTYHEWRHQFQAPGHSFASLVPDVAYLSHEALDRLGPAASEAPSRAPDIAVEILSAGEPQRKLAWKIGAYLAAGTTVVFVVDPPKRAVIAHSRSSTSSGHTDVVLFGPGDTVTHPSMPGFAYPIDAMFAGLYLGQ